jgi:hypothetical protein
MKAHLIAALAAVQLVVATPAAAADLIEDRASNQQRGAFAGASLRLPFGADQKPHAGFAFSPTQRNGATGTVKMSTGVELGFAGDRKLRLSIAGKPIDTNQKSKAGVSTLGWVGIGLGTVAVALGVTYLVFAEAMDCDADEECS